MPASAIEQGGNGRPTGERPDLEAEIARLGRLVQLQAELVASIAHDLRTPLTSVLGFTELLLKRDFEPTARERYLRIVNGEMRRFANLIDELFDAQRLAEGRGVLSFEHFDLADLLREQVDIYAGQSESHTIQLSLPAQPLTVRADRARIARVIANLLSNAIKYSPDGGTITVRAKTHDGSARVCVSDNGLGIPPEQQHLVFAKFFRADGSSAGITGAGLGLALCREIVQSHGGALGFDSTHGQGSTFWFELRDKSAADSAAA
jgi:two-component system, OmpR family, sensor histidine kinase VicK